MNSNDSKAREAFEAHLKSQPDWAPEFEVHRAWVEKFAEFAWHAALQWAASQQAAEGWRTLSESKPTHDKQLCAVEVEHGGGAEVWPARWSEQYQNFPAGLGWFEANEVKRWQPLPQSQRQATAMA